MTDTFADRYAFVFPGQGSQKLGMGREWAETHEGARRAFEEADDVLGLPLTRLCWEGPEEELQLTANLQPALLATSVAVLRAVEDAGLRATVVAGHSLGEYSALVAAGALGYADALRLVRRRGELMQQAVPVGEGAMAALLALDDAAVAAVIEEAADGQVLAAANYNAPGQTVVAGDREAVERSLEAARARGGKPRLLPVSAPFHCALMRPARDGLAPALAEATFDDPRVPVVTNVDARPATTAAEVRDALVRQIDSPVRWVESVEWMVDEAGVETFLEIGPGTVLSGLIRRIRQDAKRVALGEPTGLRKLLDQQA